MVIFRLLKIASLMTPRTLWVAGKSMDKDDTGLLAIRRANTVLSCDILQCWVVVRHHNSQPSSGNTLAVPGLCAHSGDKRKSGASSSATLDRLG